MPSIARERAVRHRSSPTTGSTCTPAATSRSSSACFARSSRRAASTRRSCASAPSGFEAARDAALAADWDALERESGATRERDARSSRSCSIDRPNAVFVWSMGLTQHAHGVRHDQGAHQRRPRARPAGPPESRPGADPRPLRRAGRRRSRLHAGSRRGAPPRAGAASGGSRCRRAAAGPPPEMVDHAAAGDVDVFWMVGGNFLETLPDAERDRGARSARPRLRIHQDIVLSSSMLVDGDGDVLLLPATTRYESPGGGTETSTERRIIFSPEIAGRRIGEARPEWQVFGEAMARAQSRTARTTSASTSAAAIRARDRARRSALRRHRDARGARATRCSGAAATLYADGRFATPDGKAHFVGRRRRDARPRAGAPTAPVFRVSTRRGKQFNSMVQREVDPLTGAAPRRRARSARDDLRGSGCGWRSRSGCGRRDGVFEGRAARGADQTGQPRGALAGRQRAAFGDGHRSGLDGARLQRGGDA